MICKITDFGANQPICLKFKDLSYFLPEKEVAKINRIRNLMKQAQSQPNRNIDEIIEVNWQSFAAYKWDIILF